MKSKMTIARAPLRVGLAGGGTDIDEVINQIGSGKVFNVTIAKYAYCTLTEQLSASTFEAEELGVSSTMESDELQLHKAVSTYFKEKFGVIQPISIKTAVDAPQGSGLGGSSSLTVAIIEAFNRHFDLNLNNYMKAKTAHYIERQIVGLSGGYQDQYAATFGGLNLMNFTPSGASILPIKLTRKLSVEFESRAILFYLRAARESAHVIDDQRRNVKKPDIITHFNYLRKSAEIMCNALLQGDFSQCGKVLEETWQSKKSTSKTISSDWIDRVIDELLKSGATGAKVSGAGGGGYVFLLVEPEKRYAVMKKITELGYIPEPVTIDEIGAYSYVK